MLTGTQQLLYARAYDLTIGPATGGARAGMRYGNTAQSQSALRIAFDLNKVAQGAATKGTISLFNVSQTTRTALVHGYQVSLSAGYLGLVERLFTGTIFKATTQRQGPDIVTTLDVIDGLRSVLYSHFDKDYPPGTKLATILSDVAKAMDVEPGLVVGLPAKKFPRGYPAHGLCINILTTLLHPYGLEARINNNKLNILPMHATLGTAAIVLSSKTGLLNIPSVNPTAISFEALLNPKLVPGQLVKLVTQNVNTSGFVQIRSCKMTGDTHEAKWSVACQGVKAVNVQAELSPATGFAYNQAVVPGLI